MILSKEETMLSKPNLTQEDERYVLAYVWKPGKAVS